MGISPLQEWNRDSHPLIFLDADVVGNVFLHHEDREVDKGGCIRVADQIYETSTSLIGEKVKISYDPLKPEIITVSYDGIKPFLAKPLQINEYCDPKPEIPVSMLPADPESSRFLEGLKRRREQSLKMQANALSFSSYGKGMLAMYEAFLKWRIPLLPETSHRNCFMNPLMLQMPSGVLLMPLTASFFAVVTADAGCGKSTLIRRFVDPFQRTDIYFCICQTRS